MNPKGSPTSPVKVNAVDTLAKWQELTGVTHPPAIIQWTRVWRACGMAMISLVAMIISTCADAGLTVWRTHARTHRE